MAQTDVPQGLAVHADLEMIVIEVGEAKGTNEWGVTVLLANFTAGDAGLFDSTDRRVEQFLRTDRNRIARRAAGRDIRLNARQIQADDIFAGFDVGMARRSIGVFPLGQKRQADRFNIKVFRARQIAHRKGNVVKGFGAKHFFLHLKILF